MSRNTVIAIAGIVIVIALIVGGVIISQNSANQNTANTTSSRATSQTSLNTNAGQTKISLATVAQHNSRSDCWIAINGKVYNVTSFINQHPGGSEILKGCGKDASSMFATEDHSDAAKNTMAQFYIGDLI